jgi:hypothetical protein
VRRNRAAAGQDSLFGADEQPPPIFINSGPPAVIEEIEGITVVRDDFMAGGTKARILPLLMTEPAEEFVYASPVFGYAQIALAHSAKALGKRATVFCAARKTRYRLTLEAEQFGAKIVEVSPGYLSVVASRARDYCRSRGAVLLPFGLDTPAFIGGLAAFARSLPVAPAEVWTVAGSGVLTRALQQAWPWARFHAVRIGAEPNAGTASVITALEQYHEDAKEPPPFASCLNYDAKTWRFVRQYASKGSLFWNCAG